jgi:hypothetical protein
MKKINYMENQSNDENEGATGKSKGYSSNRKSPRAGSGGGMAAGSPRNETFGKKSSEYYK